MQMDALILARKLIVLLQSTANIFVSIFLLMSVVFFFYLTTPDFKYKLQVLMEPILLGPLKCDRDELKNSLWDSVIDGLDKSKPDLFKYKPKLLSTCQIFSVNRHI